MDKENLMQKFGPKLTDSILQVLLEEINTLREELKLEKKTEVEIINKIEKRLNPKDEKFINDYSWAKKDLPLWVNTKRK